MVWSLDPVKRRTGMFGNDDTKRQLTFFVWPVNTAWHSLFWIQTKICSLKLHILHFHCLSDCILKVLRFKWFTLWCLLCILIKDLIAPVLLSWKWKQPSRLRFNIPSGCRIVPCCPLNTYTTGPRKLGDHGRGLGGSQKVPKTASAPPPPLHWLIKVMVIKVFNHSTLTLDLKHPVRLTWRNSCILHGFSRKTAEKTRHNKLSNSKHHPNIKDPVHSVIQRIDLTSWYHFAEMSVCLLSWTPRWQTSEEYLGGGEH